MASDNDFARVLLALHRAPSGTEAMQQLVDFARTVAGCRDAGVIMTRSRTDVDSVVATSPQMHRAQELQLQLDEGPCLDALTEPLDSVTYVPDLRGETRWPKWAREVSDLDYGSALCLPLSNESRRYGSLNLYAQESDAFGPDLTERMSLLVQHASLAMAVADSEDGLRRAIDSRKDIGVALGIVMTKFDIDEARAFEVLRRYSQDRNVKLRDVAREISTTRRLPTD